MTGAGGRPRYAHLAGRNPWVLAREAAEAAARAGAAETSDTREVPVVRIAVAGEAPGPVDRTGEVDGRSSQAGAAQGDLLRSSAVVALGTLLSRVTGLFRVGVLTYAVGGALLADAYNVANNTPNIVYELLLGGVLSATLVPLFVQRFEDDDEEAVQAVLTVATVALVVLTVLAVVTAPMLFAVYDADELSSVGVPLLRLFLLQILFYGWTALGTAVLNARRRFAVPAFAPVLNNVVVCIALVLFSLRVDTTDLDAVRGDSAALWLLGAGTTLGIVAMTLPLLPALGRAGVRMRWRFRPRHPAVRDVVRRGGWTLGYVAANQIGLTLVLRLATDAGAGVASAYTYAFIFFQLPHGLVAVSIMTTSVPELASAWTAGDTARYRARFGAGVRLLWAGIVPAAVLYAVMAGPLVALLLQRGAFDAGAAEGASSVLAAMTLGLPSFSAYLFVLRGFYAIGDTRTPFLLNVGENVLQVGLTWWLLDAVEPAGRGLGLAYAGAYTLAALGALAALHRRVGGVVDRRLVGSAARLLAVAAAMTGVLVAVQAALPDGRPDAVAVAALLAAGSATFLATATLLRIGEVRDLLVAVTSRVRRH